jgi:hypothetical protein
MLTTPPVKKIDLHFTTGMGLTARNLKGVTIKDALDVIFKANKKRVSIPDGLSRYCGIVFGLLYADLSFQLGR